MIAPPALVAQGLLVLGLAGAPAPSLTPTPPPPLAPIPPPPVPPPPPPPPVPPPPSPPLTPPDVGVPPPRRLIGCSAAGRRRLDWGPRVHRVVALTFDDGPSSYTRSVLGVLSRYHVTATFFVLGEQVRGREWLLRRALSEGSALGNHTFTHSNVAGGGWRQINSTQGTIRRATGYAPCVFRAPYGAWSGLLVSQARSLGLNSVGWSVDPRDWSRPGADAIRSRVVSATRPGAIILMHDGGGPRGQTVAAVPGIIRTLRARGYRFVTVPQLLGLHPRYAVRRRSAP